MRKPVHSIPRKMSADMPIRVLRVIARMNVGGPAAQITALHDGLDPARFQLKLLVGHAGHDEVEFLRLRGLDLPRTEIPTLSPAIGPHDIPAFFEILRCVRQFKPQVVHTHTAKAGLLGRVAAIACNVPYLVHSYHGHLLTGYYSPRVTHAYSYLEARLARRTDVLISVGNRVRDELVAAGIGSPSQYVVVPPGLTLPKSRDRSVARASLGIGTDQPVVAFVGRLTGVKRIDRLLEVARAVSSQYRDCTFIVAGDGEMRGLLERSGLPNIRLLGWVGDVASVLAASDMIILTSDNEGMPVSLIEAAALGIPAVATDVGSVREVVAHGVTGLVVSPSSDALTRAVLQLLDDPVRARLMGASAQRDVAVRFGPQRLVGDIAAVYEGLVGG